MSFKMLTGFLLLSLGWMNRVSSTPADTSLAIKCKGDNLVLNEPVPEASADDVYVFRNEVSIANTNTKATSTLRVQYLKLWTRN